jgi:hypothetical protein
MKRRISNNEVACKRLRANEREIVTWVPDTNMVVDLSGIRKRRMLVSMARTEKISSGLELSLDNIINDMFVRIIGLLSSIEHLFLQQVSKGLFDRMKILGKCLHNPGEVINEMSPKVFFSFVKPWFNKGFQFNNMDEKTMRFQYIQLCIKHNLIEKARELMPFIHPGALSREQKMDYFKLLVYAVSQNNSKFVTIMLRRGGSELCCLELKEEMDDGRKATMSWRSHDVGFAHKSSGLRPDDQNNPDVSKLQTCLKIHRIVSR